MPRFPVSLFARRGAVAARRGVKRAGRRASRIDGPDAPAGAIGFGVGAGAASMGGPPPASPGMPRGNVTLTVNPPLSRVRRDLRALGNGLNKELSAELREAVQIVATDAGTLAPRRTGALAGSYRPFAAGNKIGIRSRLPYAAVHEWGGTIQPRGVPIEIQGSHPIGEAVARNENGIADEIDARVKNLARRYGFQ